MAEQRELPYCAECVFDEVILRRLPPGYRCPSCTRLDDAEEKQLRPTFSRGLVATRLRSLATDRRRGSLRERDISAIVEIADLEIAMREAWGARYLEAIEINVLFHRLIRGESRARAARSIGCSESVVKARLETALDRLLEWVEGDLAFEKPDG